MNSVEFNKIACVALFSSLLIFGLNILGGIIYAPNHPEKPAYSVEVAESASPTGDGNNAGGAAAEPDIATLLASADVAKGEKVFKKCAACHTYDAGGKNGTGPNLYGIVGNNKAIQASFGYSKALVEKGGKWSFENLNAFFKKPKDYIPGTKMAFAGLKKGTDRANLIAFLNTKGDNPLPLPTAPAAAPEGDKDAAPVNEEQGNKQSSITPAVEKAESEKKIVDAEGAESDRNLITGTIPESETQQQTSTAEAQEQKKNKAQKNL